MVYFKMKMNAEIETLADGQIASPAGFRAGAVYAGIKPGSKKVFDLGLLFSETVCNTAAVFTTNKIQAAPVILDRAKLSRSHQAQAVFVNAGCANACTGDEGMTNAVTSASLIAKHLGIDAGLVQVCSTGVIGTQLPMAKIADGIPRFALSTEGGHDFSQAIMTTDTQPKKIAVQVKTPEFTFTVGGTAKGAGMIHPNMATLLGFLTTDAAVEPNFLQASLKKAVAVSFNMITVDGDTSTNDTVILMANGRAGNKTISQGDQLAGPFQKALQQVCLYLAKCIAKDGEGATRLIEVEINGARSGQDARLAARTIANSPLVKTAVHGCDPNWGRIIAAAGRSGAELVSEKADVFIGRMCLMEAGRPLAFDKKAAAALLNQDEVLLKVNLNLGKGRATAWGCDLSAQYVAINAEYTT
jgi:glutamate N-acetyltransferase / amino-acid N-acetyltransferase